MAFDIPDEVPTFHMVNPYLNANHPATVLEFRDRVVDTFPEQVIVNDRKVDSAFLRETTRKAWPIVWTIEMMQMGSQAADSLTEWLPVTRDLLPRPTVIWIFESMYVASFSFEAERVIYHNSLDDTNENAHILYIPGMILHAREDGLSMGILDLSALGLRQSLQLNATVKTFRWGEVPEDAAAQNTLKLARFAQSPYLAYDEPRIPRSTARRAQRSGTSTELAFITLRRKLNQIGMPSRSDEKHTVDWQCQWPVSGHWRRQPYGDGVRRPIWIAPVIKGPADKPFRGDPGKIMR